MTLSGAHMVHQGSKPCKLKILPRRELLVQLVGLLNSTPTIVARPWFCICFKLVVLTQVQQLFVRLNTRFGVSRWLKS
jgi:hypothetical protein